MDGIVARLRKENEDKWTIADYRLWAVALVNTTLIISYFHFYLCIITCISCDFSGQKPPLKLQGTTEISPLSEEVK